MEGASNSGDILITRGGGDELVPRPCPRRLIIDVDGEIFVDLRGADLTGLEELDVDARDHATVNLPVIPPGCAAVVSGSGPAVVCTLGPKRFQKMSMFFGASVNGFSWADGVLPKTTMFDGDGNEVMYALRQGRNIRTWRAGGSSGAEPPPPPPPPQAPRLPRASPVSDTFFKASVGGGSSGVSASFWVGGPAARVARPGGDVLFMALRPGAHDEVLCVLVPEGDGPVLASIVRADTRYFRGMSIVQGTNENVINGIDTARVVRNMRAAASVPLEQDDATISSACRELVDKILVYEGAEERETRRV